MGGYQAILNQKEHSRHAGNAAGRGSLCTRAKAQACVDPPRRDYELVQTYLGMEKPFDVQTAFTTRMLDNSVKMDASKVKE
jgi:hypothetical protein